MDGMNTSRSSRPACRALRRTATILIALIAIAALFGGIARAGMMVCVKSRPGSVELRDRRTQFSKTFRNPDGTFTWVAAAADRPIHYRDASGRWQEIDPTIRRTTVIRGYDYAMTENTFHAYFVGRLSDGILAKMQLEDTWVRYAVADSFQPSVPHVDGSVITYPEVYPGADIRYTLKEAGAKQEIILHRYTGKNEFRFRLSMNGLSAVLEEDGSVRFYDAAGQ